VAIGLSLGICPCPSSAGQKERLTELSLEQLGNIEVTSVSKEPEQVRKTPAAIFVITQDDIHRSGATSIPEALRMAPGVEVARVDSDHWSVGIRGFGGVLASKILVLIDGRSVYTPLYAGVYWSVQNVMLEDVDRIEVIRGPGGTIWGANAVDGVINIITKSSKDTRGTLVTAGGGNVDQGTAGVRYGGGAKELNYRIYANAFIDGPEYHFNGDRFDHWRMGQMGFRTDWTSDDNRDSATLQGDLYDQRAGQITQVGSLFPPEQLTLSGMGQFSGGDIMGHWQRTFAGGSDVQVRAYYDHTNHFEPQFGERRNTFDVDFIHHLKLPRQQDFIWGLGARVSPSDFVQLVPTLNFSPNRFTDQIYSGFVQDMIPLAGDKVEITLGSKLEHNNYTGFEIQPNAHLLWTPTPRQTFWASISRAVRTPSRLEESLELTDYLAPDLYLLISGNRNFAAERLIAVEAGYRTMISTRLYFDLALFRNSYDNLYGYGTPSVNIATQPIPYTYFEVPIANEERGFTDGVELGPEFDVTRWWQLRGSYSFLHVNIETTAGNPNAIEVENLATVQGSSPHHQVEFQSRINLPKRFEFDQTYRYVSGLSALAVGGYNTADVRLGWHMTRQLELSVEGQNLFQPQHIEFAGDPGGAVGIRRSAYAKLTWRSEGK
jgi:iron complex outermembrane receptor protein